MQLAKRLINILLIAFLSLSLPTTSFAFDGTPPNSIDIVYIVDVSGSMDQNDRQRFARDALQLGVDLAPENSRIAIISVNHTVVSETTLTDVSTSEGRNYLKNAINQLYNQGNTDFTPGFERALEILAESATGRAIFLGDFSEGGYNAGTSYQQIVAQLDDIAARARNNGIPIDMILWETAPPNSITAPAFLNLPTATGGTLIEETQPNRLPAHIHDIYFQNFEYTYNVLNIRGEAGQAIHIPMPTNNVRRARIYVSAQAPPSAFGAVYSGANIDGGQNRSYAMIDLLNPSTDGVNLTISPGPSGSATIYTLLEYGPLALAVTTDHALSEEAQLTTLYAQIIDVETGTPLLTTPYPDNATFTLELFSSNGQAVPFTSDTSTPTELNLSLNLPEEFGTHQVTGVLTVGRLTFGPLTAFVEIPDTRVIPQPPNWPLIIALSIGALIVLGGIIIAYRIKRKEAIYQGAAEMRSDYKFHGKLSVYAILLEGGARELRPFDFALHTIGDKRITLRSVLDSIGAKDTYQGAESILLLTGPEESIIIRNNSKATIKVMGRSYESHSKVQMFYDQKCTILFDDSNELEINFRRVKNEDTTPPIHFNVKSSRAYAHHN